MIVILYVALGGAIGSVVRYLLAGAVNASGPSHSPAGTFAVNVIGCFLFGLIAGGADRQFTLDAHGRAFLLAGLLGGFTTFSSFAYETFLLAGRGEVMLAAGNAAGQVVAGLLALWAGYSLLR